MKAWNKPVRLWYTNCTEIFTENGTEPYNPWLSEWGITDWFVGHCNTIWEPWLQISFGRLSVQIKWYIIIPMIILTAFLLGTLI